MAEHQTEEILETALAALKREAQGVKGRMAISIGIWALSVLLAILGLGWLTEGRSIGLIPLSLALACILVCAAASPPHQCRALDALDHVAEVRAIGPLLDLLPTAFAGRKKKILALLTRLLPTLLDRDTGLLKPSHRIQLRTTLVVADFRQEREYLIGILKALEQIGDSEDLALVTRMAIDQSDSWQERQVREAARACLPILRERVEQQNHRGILLRPASAVAPEELLHPAIGGCDPDPRQLLRPNQTTVQETSSLD